MLSQSVDHAGSSRLSVGSRQGLKHLPDSMFSWVRYMAALLTLTLVVGLPGRVAGDEVKSKSPAQQQFEKGVAQLGEKNYAQAEASFKRRLKSIQNLPRRTSAWRISANCRETSRVPENSSKRLLQLHQKAPPYRRRGDSISTPKSGLRKPKRPTRKRFTLIPKRHCLTFNSAIYICSL